MYMFTYFSFFTQLLYMSPLDGNGSNDCYEFYHYHQLQYMWSLEGIKAEWEGSCKETLTCLVWMGLCLCGCQEAWMNGSCLVTGSPVTSPGLGTILWRQLRLSVVTAIEHLLVPWLSSWRCSPYRRIKSQLCRVVSKIKSCFTMMWRMYSE